jgi:hypothetical protein
MRRAIITILLIILPSICLAEYPPINFYTDGIIQDGNAFSVVRTFDNAIVDMTGGLIETRLELHETSIFNVCGGSLSEWSDIAVLDYATLNFYNLQTTPSRIWTEGNNATINVYGKNFLYEQHSSDWWLRGNWANGEEFILNFRGPYTHDYVNLHEIPEPCTLAFLLLGVFGMAKKNR